eukprot:gnl/TRDRNA2_/TRDRNA2_174209_c2_seq3.p1 gnl/TRDRNA2_/TRDRNA2_174209_c2~~gnl/TRDRNA2_/TRDRNA2_174209_c2_seq3.p1  ORF type:complete len:312 (+),score=116.04 gnl/TRDRNA2_/TRDRNA2_174209_c2_seq3:219-1154(+)
MENLKPSQWFMTQKSKFDKQFKEWNDKLSAYKAAAQKRVSDKAAKKAQKAAAQRKKENDKRMKELAKKKKEEERKKKIAAGEKVEEEKEEDEPMEEEAPDAEEEDEAEPEKADFEALDVFGVEDVLDVGTGEPLCTHFSADDWGLCTLRFELYLLAHAFKKDADDPDRIGIHIDHLPYYYQKYYKKTLSAKSIGLESFKDISNILGDIVYIGEKEVLQSGLPEELESYAVFLKLAEEARHDRLLRLDLGDETAKLNIRGYLNQVSAPAASAAPVNGKGAGKDGTKAAAPVKKFWGQSAPVPGKGAKRKGGW